ncbi:MAG TPA: hypothetical protein VMT85_14765 [Thermoanaerobaculia bacterium]|nr:hypothetical protein [Thermoanaerobaculia bacterium]
MTENATAPGGLKEKREVSAPAEGSVRFQGEIRLPDGSTYLDRTTLTPLADGEVRQHIEVSGEPGEELADDFRRDLPARRRDAVRRLVVDSSQR